MGRVLIAALAALAAGAPRSRPDDPASWAEAWERLAALEAGQASESAASEGELARWAAARHDELRGRVLSELLARCRGASPHPVPVAEGERLTPAPGEAWTLARALAPGPLRESLLARALAELEGEAFRACQAEAWTAFRAHAEGARSERALPLAEALHDSAQATWSALDLAIARTRAGDYAGAREVVGEQLARCAPGRAGQPDRAALLAQRGITSLGAGDERRARADFGAAMARGSTDGALVLGRMALARSRVERCRSLHRSLLAVDPPQAWALRGWGLSMLPALPSHGAHPSPDDADAPAVHPGSNRSY